MEINWSITAMERNVADGGVLNVDWVCHGQDGEYRASIIGGTVFAYDPESSNFVQYEELTEAQVVGWVKDQMGEEVKTANEQEVLRQIENAKKPKLARGTPWEISPPAPPI